jgi:hypothetical protein
VLQLRAAIPSMSALRRAIALLCAVAFLAVGFVDAVQHHDAGAHSVISISQDDPGAADDGLAGKPANAVDHCYACAMVAVLIDAPALPRVPAMIDPQTPAGDAVTPHPPIIETPPPIAAI